MRSLIDNDSNIVHEEAGLMIKLCDHKNVWDNAFKAFKNELLAKSEKNIIDIQHIGSTSINEVKAKDIVDVQLGVNSFDDIDYFASVLEEMGLSCIDSIRQDHVPFHDADYFDPQWEKRFFKGCYQGQAFNCHIRLYNNLNWKFALAFKNHLATDAHARYAFMQFKQRLVNADVSIENYCLIKDSVIDLLSMQFEESSQGHESK